MGPGILLRTLGLKIIYYKKIEHDSKFTIVTKCQNFNTVRNLITFSIVFTYKNGLDRFDPPPHHYHQN